MPLATDAVWIDVLPSLRGFKERFKKDLPKELPSETPAPPLGEPDTKNYKRAVLAAFAVVGAGAVAAGKGLYNIGAAFDDVSDTIRVGTGATGAALKDLEQSAKNIGQNVPAEFADIGTAVADLNTRLGLTGQPLESMAAQFLELSRITGTDLSANIEGITRVFGDWGIAAEDQSASLDAIYRASQATGAGIDSLSRQVVQFGAPMRQLGFSFEETLGLLGKFEKEGVNTELVMGSMRIALGRMAKDGEAPVETLSRVVDQIQNAGSAGEANALALEMFGARAGPDMAAAIREGRFELGDLLGQIEGGSDTIMAAGEQTRDFSEQWQLFKNRAMVDLAPLAERVFATLTAGMEWISTRGVPAIRELAGWMDRNRVVVGVVVGVIAALTAVTIAHTAAMAIQSVGLKALLLNTTLVSGAMRVWTAVQWLVNAALAANPIGIVVLAIAGLIAVVVLAYKNNENFRKNVQAVWAAIKTAIGATISWFTDTAWPALKSAWAAIVADVGRLRTQIKTAWDEIKAGWDATVRGIQWAWNNILKPTWDAIVGAARWMWNSVLRPTWDLMRAGWANLVNGIQVVWARVLSPVFTAVRDGIGRVKSAFDTARDGIARAWNAIRDAAKAPIRFVVNTVMNSAIIDNFNKLARFFGAKTVARVALPRGFADGGWLSGPGTGTSDSILARVSNGEFIVREQQARKWGPLLEQINTPGFAGGGWIGDAWDKVKGGVSGVLGMLRDPGKALQAALDRVLGGIGGAGFGEALKSMPSRLVSAAVTKIKSVIDSAAAAPGESGGSANGLTPNARALRSAALSVFGPMTIGGFARRNIAGTNKLSDHALGKALDFMTSNVALGNAITDFVLSWPSVKYAIWRQTYYPKGGAPRRMADRGSVTQNHYDHVHASVFDQGGWLGPGAAAVNLSRKPEAVFTAEQFATFQRIADGGSTGPAVWVDKLMARDDATVVRLLEQKQRVARVRAGMGAAR